MERNLHEGHRSRMIEKFLSANGDLPDHELLEILLFFAIPRVDTNPIAHRLLLSFGNLSSVFNATVEQLMTVKGVGESTASFLLLCGKLLDKINSRRSHNIARTTLNNFSETKTVVERLFEGLKVERVVIFLLGKSYELKYTVIFDGDSCGVDIDVQEIANKIALFTPCSVILAHNHLSGNPEPSVKDDLTTRHLHELCKVCGTNLIEHLIYSCGKSFSYKQSDRLSFIKNAKNTMELVGVDDF